MGPGNRRSTAVATLAALGLLALGVPAVVLAIYLWPAPAPLRPEVAIDLGTLPAAGEAVPLVAPAGHVFSANGPVSELDPVLPVESGWFTRSSAGFFALAAYSSDTGCRLNFVDRKSTRLNSSHRCISYAVFCLKKQTRVLLRSPIPAEVTSGASCLQFIEYPATPDGVASRARRTAAVAAARTITVLTGVIATSN